MVTMIARSIAAKQRLDSSLQNKGYRQQRQTVSFTVTYNLTMFSSIHMQYRDWLWYHCLKRVSARNPRYCVQINAEIALNEDDQRPYLRDLSDLISVFLIWSRSCSSPKISRSSTVFLYARIRTREWASSANSLCSLKRDFSSFWPREQ